MVSIERHTQSMDKVRALVNVRERSISEVKERLKKAEFTDEEINDAIETSLRCNIISDERFASAYIRGKVRLGWGRTKILSRLKEKGISDEIISLCANDFPSSEDEYSQALKILQKRPSNSNNKFASYVNRLLRKGYSYDLAKRVAKDFIADEV